MSTSNPRRPPPQPRQLGCATCGTENHVTIHSVTALDPGGGDLVTVSYTCDACRQFQEHLAYATDVAAALHQVRSMAQVIMFGDEYVHCGYPMADAAFEIVRLGYRTGGAGDDPGAVCLPTRVLRCRCGFQLEVPE